jgi:hypothetical protein
MAMSDVREVLKTEFSEDFVQGMRDRMVMSFYKYGAVAEAFPHKISAIASLTDRMRKYVSTGNTEFLIDAANFAMIEFMCPSVDGATFKPTDSDESPGRRTTRSGTVDHRSNAEVGTNPHSKTAQFR